MPLTVILVYACGLGWMLMYSQSDYARAHFVNFFAPSRFAEFLAGIYLAGLFLVSQEWKHASVSDAMQASGILLMVVGAICKQYAPWLLGGGVLIIPGAGLLILGLAHGHGRFVAHLSRPWLNRLGIASFSLYMVHDPVLRAVRGTFLYLGWEVHSWLTVMVIGLVIFVLVQTAALMMCHSFEIPMRKRLRAMVKVSPSYSNCT